MILNTWLKASKNGWKTTTGRSVANQDLWKKLEDKLRDVEGRGMLVQFWKIPREWNEADQYAKAGAVIILYYYYYFLNEILFTHIIYD